MNVLLYNPLRAILSNNITEENFDNYNLLIEDDYPFNPIEQEIFSFVQVFVEQHNALPSLKYTRKHFESTARHDLMEYMDSLSEIEEYTHDDFKDFISKASDARKDKDFQNILKTTSGIFNFGEQIEKEFKKGRKDALDYFFSHAERFGQVHSERQVGLLSTDALMVWKTYEYYRDNPQDSSGIMSGIKVLDDFTGGGKPTELGFVLGFTSGGKSTLCMNWAYNAAIHQGKNVVYFSLEMPKIQVERILIARHSANPMFAAMGMQPIPTKGLEGKDVKITLEQQEFMAKYVIPDLTENTQYGKIFVEYPGDNFTFSSMKAKLIALSKKYKIDMVVFDYPGIMQPDKGQGNKGDFVLAQNQIIKNIKQLCVTFNDGEGIFGLCPFQSNRQGYERAVKEGGQFDLSAINYANEVEKSADFVFSIFKEQNAQNKPEAILSCLKNRNGKFFPLTKIAALWDSHYMSNCAEEASYNPDEVDWSEVF